MVDVLDYSLENVTILILIDGFLQYKQIKQYHIIDTDVTILILIDGFLQWKTRINYL